MFINQKSLIVYWQRLFIGKEQKLAQGNLTQRRGIYWNGINDINADIALSTMPVNIENTIINVIDSSKDQNESSGRGYTRTILTVKQIATIIIIKLIKHNIKSTTTPMIYFFIFLFLIYSINLFHDIKFFHIAIVKPHYFFIIKIVGIKFGKE